MTETEITLLILLIGFLLQIIAMMILQSEIKDIKRDLDDKYIK